jgi:hypothetical protein
MDQGFQQGQETAKNLTILLAQTIIALSSLFGVHFNGNSSRV